MALTLSVGFVVDDAIVMLENIVRHMEMGKPPMRAAFDGSKEISFTILSMTVSLTAVFIPVLFMGGIVGRLLHEFAVTIGVAILVSGFVSISLTPMLCSRFLKPPHTQKHGWFYNATERMFDALAAALRLDAAREPALPRRDDGRLDRAAVRHRLPLHARARRAFCRARIRAASTSAPKRCRASASTTWSAISKGGRHRRERAGHRRLSATTSAAGPGGGGLNTGRISVDLKPRAERKLSVDQIIAELRPKLAQVPGIRVFMVNQPPINLGGQQGARSLYQFTLQDTDTAELYQWAPMLEAKVRDLPGIEDVSSDLQIKNPQVQVDDGPRQDLGAGPDRQPGGDGALQRVRHAPGVADLRAEQPVSGDPAGGAGVPAGPGGAVDALRALVERQPHPAEHAGDHEDRRRAV